MLNCRFCKRIAEESSINDLPLGIQGFINTNNFKHFSCECGMSWIELNNNEEIFNLELFGKSIRTLNDFADLIKELEDNMHYYTAVPAIKDCLLRINDWLVDVDTQRRSVEDPYVQNQIGILKKLSEYYYENN